MMEWHCLDWNGLASIFTCLSVPNRVRNGYPTVSPEPRFGSWRKNGPAE
jgi:hypothetical protein